MKSNKNKVNLGLIVMNKGEHIAVISLLVIIAIFLSFSVFRPALHFPEKDLAAFHNLDSLIAMQEEAAQKHASEQASREASDDGAGTKTTVSSKATANSARTSKGSSNTTKGSQNTAKTSSNTTTSHSKNIPILELNTTDSVALVALPQIGEVMASRIHRYRERLGGFVCFEQLYEVKGMDSARFATVRPYLQLEATNTRKLEVNRDEFKTLLRHPYLDYDQVKAIVNYREKKGLIRNWEQLQGIVGEVNPLLERYVTY